MHVNSWKKKRDELCLLIKKVSDQYGGDDIDWLRDYTKDVINSNKEDLYKAIEYFDSLWYGLGKEPLVERIISFKPYVCKMCGYVPPFCYYIDDNICSN